LLYPIHVRHPEISQADIWTLAGACAVEFLGGPAVPHKLGRSDDKDGARCPPNGLLPDAAQGAQHLRDVFYRMGFNDRDIVALSGAHTLGRCHLVRSGFDGKWTDNPLVFDNQYYVNLMTLDWQPKQTLAGKNQFEAQASNGDILMMLPTDIALRTDPEFAKYAALYMREQATFFTDFASAYSRLMAAGCPATCDPHRSVPPRPTAALESSSEQFREWAMHGSIEHVKNYAPSSDVHALESSSGRSALHKGAYWGHTGLCTLLLTEYKLNANVQDFDGDSALHDAARFGHVKVVETLLANGANTALVNKQNQTAADVARFNGAAKFGIEKVNFDTVSHMLEGAGKTASGCPFGHK